MEKKQRKQNKSKYTRLTDVISDSSTQLLGIQVENPNQYLYRIDGTHPLMNSSFRDSVEGSFINVSDKRHLKYSDSILLLPEQGTFEDTSDNESELCEKMSYLQNERKNSQEELISPKLNKFMKNIQFKCRNPGPKNSDNSVRRQCKCNRGDTKPYITQKNTIKDHSIVKRNFDGISLTINPVEMVHKIDDRKVGIHDREIAISSLKHVSNNNEELETDISNQKFQQYDFDNGQECIVNSENMLPLRKIHENCPKCTISKEKHFAPKIQETECFPYDRYGPEVMSKCHRDFRAPFFKNSNIPIAKRVLEEDQFYDLRQIFCGAENTFLNASKPKKDEQSFNRMNTDNKEIYQPDEKSYFEEENAKCPRIRYATHFTEEIENENQPSSSTCDSSGKEEEMCNYWKSLKTKKVSQQRNKGVQVEIPSVRPNDAELLFQMNTDETKGFFKHKSQEAIQNKQGTTKQAQGTTVKENAQSSSQNQSTQKNRNPKVCIPIESPQIEIMEHYPEVQLSSAQIHDGMRLTENRTCMNCKSFLPSRDYQEERTDSTKPRTIHSRSRLLQTESHNPCNEHLLSEYTQLTENTENIQYCDNSYLRPNVTRKWENMHNRYNADGDLQNKHNDVCNPTMPMNYYENNQYSNTYNDTRQRQMQRMYLEQENVPLSNHFVQHDKYKHRRLPTEENSYYNSEQTAKSQLPNFRESTNKMPVTTHRYISNMSSVNDPNNQTNSWNDGNAVLQENKLYVRNRDIQNEDNSMQLLSHNTKKNKQKMHNVSEIDVKTVQTSEVISIPPNHAKEYSKQTSKEKPKKSKAQIKVDAAQAVEKSTAEQIQAKENVMKQIKRMYSHMDPNVHETNKTVINQVEKELKSKGMWHSEK